MGFDPQRTHDQYSNAYVVVHVFEIQLYTHMLPSFQIYVPYQYN